MNTTNVMITNLSDDDQNRLITNIDMLMNAVWHDFQSITGEQITLLTDLLGDIKCAARYRGKEVRMISANDWPVL